MSLWQTVKRAASFVMAVLVMIWGVGTLGVIIFVIVMSSTGQEERTWKFANEKQDKFWLEKYVKDYPKGEHIKAATEMLEDALWAEAEKQKFSRYGFRADYDLIENYIKRFPKGKYAGVARVRQDNDFWNDVLAEYQDTVTTYPILEYAYGPDPYTKYLKAFPDGLRSSDAKDALYKMAVGRRTASLFEELIRLGGGSYVVQQAKDRLAELEDWAIAQKEDSYAGYLAFLEKWKYGMFRGKAIELLTYHEEWKPLPAAAKGEKTIERVAVDWDSLPQGQPIAAADYASNEALGSKCLENKEFSDLIDGFRLAEAHYNRYRVFLGFGFNHTAREAAKSGAQALLKEMPLEVVKNLAAMALKKIKLSDQQRDAVRALARTALVYEAHFDTKLNKRAEDILRVVGSGGQSWKDLGFPKSSDPCLGLPFLYGETPGALGGADATIEGTLYDFWYLRHLEGTKAAVSAAFKTVVATE